MKPNIFKDGSINSYRAAYKESISINSICARICGLSDAEFWVLLMLREGHETQSEISEQLSISKQTINSACKKLIKKGFVRMQTLKNNLRTKKICLTEIGKNCTDEKINKIAEIEEKVWGSLSENERTTLTGLMNKFNMLMKNNLQNSFALANSAEK